MPAVTDALSSSAVQSTSTRDAFSDLTSEEFVKIMFTELSNQDPLKPNDSSQMLEQLSSLRSIQSDIELGNKLEDVVTQNQLSTAGALIGKWVAGLTGQNFRVYGQVDSVSRTSDGPVLNLSNGYSIPFNNLDHVLAEDPTPAPTT
ncbi:MAG: flagellar biosynthesis protein FlgD [Phycisphaerales bacterium]|nr:flagellar biosynthesis protein FlgD [Phycisphaerales bacterium]